MPNLNIKYTDIDKLIPYEYNSRTHTDEQIKQVSESIKSFGFNNPILIDQDKTVIAGHARLQAAKILGLSQVPTIELPHLTKGKKEAYIIADNKIALNAGWSLDLLNTEFAKIQDAGLDLDITGFTSDEINSIMNPDIINDGLCDPDDVQEIEDNCITVDGDLWIMGNHRLMCGDSTSINMAERLMNGKKAHMVFTDPPYGIEYQSNMRTKSKKFDVLKNDDNLLDIAPIIKCISEGWIFIWTSWKVISEWIDQLSLFGYPSNMIIWHKPGGGIGDLNKTFSSDYEVALVWHRGADLCGKRIGSVWTIKKDSASSYIHPTQKPVALAVEALDKCTSSNNNILDLFAGSGSTLIACEKTNRKCYMMEISPRYCDVIVKRWQKFTGKEAILEGTNKKFNEINDAS